MSTDFSLSIIDYKDVLSFWNYILVSDIYRQPVMV